MNDIGESINILRASRQNYLKFIDWYDLDALNHTPTKFNNNLVWNFGHVIVTHQLLCYNLSDLNMPIDKSLVPKYRKGTKPEAPVSQQEVSELKELAVELVDKFEEDYNRGIFKVYNAYQTSYGFKIEDIQDAVAFNNVHEGLHIGSCLAIMKFLD